MIICDMNEKLVLSGESLVAAEVTFPQIVVIFLMETFSSTRTTTSNSTLRYQETNSSRDLFFIISWLILGGGQC